MYIHKILWVLVIIASIVLNTVILSFFIQQCNRVCVICCCPGFFSSSVALAYHYCYVVEIAVAVPAVLLLVMNIMLCLGELKAIH